MIGWRSDGFSRQRADLLTKIYSLKARHTEPHPLPVAITLDGALLHFRGKTPLKVDAVAFSQANLASVRDSGGVAMGL